MTAQMWFVCASAQCDRNLKILQCFSIFQKCMKSCVPSGHITFIQRRIIVDTTLWRFIDVDATMSQRRVPAGLVSNWKSLQAGYLYSYPANILYKSIAGRYRPVSYPDGPITARYRFIKNAYWVPWLYGILILNVWRTLRYSRPLISNRRNASKCESGRLLPSSYDIQYMQYFTLTTPITTADNIHFLFLYL